MARKCTVCTHERRSEIDAQIVSGSSFRVIARQFTIGHDAVQRHASDHIAQEIKQSQAAKEEAKSLDVVKQLKAINGMALKILKQAHDSGQNLLALQAMDRISKQLELQAKLLGDIDSPTVNVYVTPEWRQIRTIIIQALTPYPDARIAVASQLAELEASHARLN